MNDFNENSFDDFEEKTVGAFDFFPLPLNLQNNNEIVNSSPQAEDVQPSSYTVVDENIEENVVSVSDETSDSATTNLDKQKDISLNQQESAVSEINEEDFEEKTVGIFGEVPVSANTNPDKQEDVSLNQQESVVSEIIEEDDFEEKTIGIFGESPVSVNKGPDKQENLSLNQQETVVSELSEKAAFDNPTASNNETLNENEKNNKTVTSQDTDAKKFLNLAIVFFILAIISLVFFPLAIVFIILGVKNYKKYQEIKNKSNN